MQTETDQEFLRRTGLLAILEELRSATLRQRPEDVHAFLIEQLVRAKASHQKQGTAQLPSPKPSVGGEGSQIRKDSILGYALLWYLDRHRLNQAERERMWCQDAGVVTAILRQDRAQRNTASTHQAPVTTVQTSAGPVVVPTAQLIATKPQNAHSPIGSPQRAHSVRTDPGPFPPTPTPSDTHKEEQIVPQSASGPDRTRVYLLDNAYERFLDTNHVPKDQRAELRATDPELKLAQIHGNSPLQLKRKSPRPQPVVHFFVGDDTRSTSGQSKTPSTEATKTTHKPADTANTRVEDTTNKSIGPKSTNNPVTVITATIPHSASSNAAQEDQPSASVQLGSTHKSATDSTIGKDDASTNHTIAPKSDAAIKADTGNASENTIPSIPTPTPAVMTPASLDTTVPVETHNVQRTSIPATTETLEHADSAKSTSADVGRTAPIEDTKMQPRPDSEVASQAPLQEFDNHNSTDEPVQTVLSNVVVPQHVSSDGENSPRSSEPDATRFVAHGVLDVGSDSSSANDSPVIGRHQIDPVLPGHDSTDPVTEESDAAAGEGQQSTDPGPQQTQNAADTSKPSSETTLLEPAASVMPQTQQPRPVHEFATPPSVSSTSAEPSQIPGTTQIRTPALAKNTSQVRSEPTLVQGAPQHVASSQLPTATSASPRNAAAGSHQTLARGIPKESPKRAARAASPTIRTASPKVQAMRRSGSSPTLKQRSLRAGTPTNMPLSGDLWVCVGSDWVQDPRKFEIDPARAQLCSQGMTYGSVRGCTVGEVEVVNTKFASRAVTMYRFVIHFKGGKSLVVGARTQTECTRWTAELSKY